MAQFRSQAREGSFSDNQTIVPDEVRKIQQEGERRRRGMTTAQAHLQKNQEIFLQAQIQSQAIEQESRERARDINKSNKKAEQEGLEANWKRSLAQEEAKSKNKQDTFGALAAFSKTALDITQGIVKYNKDNQLKAINQISVKQQLSYKDLLMAKSVDSSISKADWQESNQVQDLLKQGKSQEFINTMYDHLIKGGGYRNYINNSNVLIETANSHSRVLIDIANDPSLSVAEKRKKLETTRSQLLGQMEIDGRIPGAQILNSAYTPTIRKALQRAEDRLNRETVAKLGELNTNNRIANINKVAYSGGVFNGPAVMEQVATDPRPGAILETVQYLGPKLNIQELDDLAKATFNRGGQQVSIETSYIDAAAKIESFKKQRRTEAVQRVAAESEARQLKATMAMNQAAQQLATDDGVLSNADYRKVLEIGDQTYGGPGRNTTNDNFYKRQTIDQKLIPVMRDQLEEMRLNKTLSMKEIERINPPKVLYDEYAAAASRLDTIKATPQYKELTTYLEGRISSNIQNIPALQFKDTGPQSDQFNWFVGKKTKEAKKQVIDLVGAGRPIEEAMNTVGTTIADEAKKFLEDPKTFDKYTLKPYEKMVDEQTKAQLIAQRRVVKYKQLTRTKQRDMGEVIKAIGEDPLIAASKKLAETGNSEVLNVIGQRIGMNAYEVQEKLAEASPKIEPIQMNPTYAEIQKSFSRLSPSQRYTFTDNKPANEQRMRALQEIKNRSENRNSFKPRESFQTSGESYQANGSNVISQSGNNNTKQLAVEGANLINSLSDQDFNDLAYAVSSEAALGTDDEFGVAANILTRLMVGGFGNNINEIINAPGQYEGVYSGASERKDASVKQAIAESLKSDTGKLKLLEFIKRLDGRAYFKGQTLLKNRVPSEDPMFAETGNFYHR